MSIRECFSASTARINSACYELSSQIGLVNQDTGLYKTISEIGSSVFNGMKHGAYQISYPFRWIAHQFVIYVPYAFESVVTPLVNLTSHVCSPFFKKEIESSISVAAVKIEKPASQIPTEPLLKDVQNQDRLRHLKALKDEQSVVSELIAALENEVVLVVSILEEKQVELSNLREEFSEKSRALKTLQGTINKEGPRVKSLQRGQERVIVHLEKISSDIQKVEAEIAHLSALIEATQSNELELRNKVKSLRFQLAKANTEEKERVEASLKEAEGLHIAARRALEESRPYYAERADKIHYLSTLQKRLEMLTRTQRLKVVVGTSAKESYEGHLDQHQTFEAELKALSEKEKILESSLKEKQLEKVEKESALDQARLKHTQILEAMLKYQDVEPMG